MRHGAGEPRTRDETRGGPHGAAPRSATECVCRGCSTTPVGLDSRANAVDASGDTEGLAVSARRLRYLANPLAVRDYAVPRDASCTTRCRCCHAVWRSRATRASTDETRTIGAGVPPSAAASSTTGGWTGRNIEVERIRPP